jgi:Ca2+-binding EF-hand superfamily protein
MRVLVTRRGGSYGAVGVLAALAGVFLLVGAMGALADSMDGPTAEQAREAHAEVDLNDDGWVDREEFYRRMVDIFYLNDVDKDGHLNRDELKAIQEEMVYAPADQNHDGKLTLAEYIDQRFVAFHTVDVDSNGLISVDEVVAAYTSP